MLVQTLDEPVVAVGEVVKKAGLGTRMMEHYGVHYI
jgi:hypothetical protein